MSRRLGALFSALAVSILITACGGDPVTFDSVAPPSVVGENTTASTSPDEKSPIGDIDPCKLITKPEAAEALGSPVGDPVASTEGEVLGCSYDSVDVETVGDRATILVTSAADFDRVVTDPGTSAFVYDQIEGIGDAALIQRRKVQFGEGTSGELVLVKFGDVTIKISVASQSMSGADAIEAEKALARTAIERL